MPDLSSAPTPLSMRLPSAVTNVMGGGNSNNGNDSFGLARSIPRVWQKISFILAATGGNWVPQPTQLIAWEHGINDNFQGVANPFANAGISGLPVARSVEITNAMRNGGFSMVWHAILLSLGLLFERLRVITPDANNTVARVQRGGGSVGDNEWALIDRLLPTILAASEFSLIPVNTATDCNLLLGIPQITTVGTGWEQGGIVGLGQNFPGARWVFRDDIVLDPGLSSNQDQPNRVAWDFRGNVTNVEKLTDSISRADGTLLAFDCMMIADVAYGVFNRANGDFQFATQFDADKYAAYRACM